MRMDTIEALERIEQDVPDALIAHAVSATYCIPAGRVSRNPVSARDQVVTGLSFESLGQDCVIKNGTWGFTGYEKCRSGK